MRVVALWSSAGATSAAVNVALLAVFALAIRPLPHPPQHLPPPSLDMVTPDVPQGEAQALTARGKDASTERTGGVQTGAVAMPVSTTESLTLPATELPPVARPPPIPAFKPQTPSVAPMVASDASISAAQMIGDRLSAVSEGALPVVAAPAPGADVVSSRPVADVTVRATLPAGIPEAAAALAEGVATPAEPADGVLTTTLQVPAAIAPTVTPDRLAAPAAILPPPADHTVASLAWAGDAGAIESASLTAIAAFMQPGDLGDLESSANRLRDGLETALDAVPCARLQTVFMPETGVMELRGHIPEADLGPPLLAALQAQVGSTIPVIDKTLILPRPQCTALAGIATVGLPQSDEQITNPRVVGPDSYAREYSFVGGDLLVLELQAPDYDSFVYVDYFDANGNVLHLQPNDIVALTPVPARTRLVVGSDDPLRPSLQITVSPPFGQEIAVAFAASAPLYEGVRPIEEPAAPYLDWLQDRVSDARARDAAFKGEWVYFFVLTRAR